MFVFDLYSKQNYKNNIQSNNPIEKIHPTQRSLIVNPSKLFEHKHPRIIIPNNIIDLYKNINKRTSTKTIIHVLNNNIGIGDFLRGSILLAQYAKHFNINFKIDVSKHNINYFLENKTETDHKYTTIHIIDFTFKNEQDIILNSLLNTFLNSNENAIYISTNLFYNQNLLTYDIKNYINSFFLFKKEYYHIANNLCDFKKYNVLHIRCKDEHFYTDFEDNYLLTEILKLQLNNTIVISNNYSIKKKINKLFGFCFLDKPSNHSGNSTNYTELETTIIEYIILSKSIHTYCFSYYGHGSGFSEQCSVLNNIPYNIVYLPKKNMNNNDIHLLINHYDKLLEKLI